MRVLFWLLRRKHSGGRNPGCKQQQHLHIFIAMNGKMSIFWFSISWSIFLVRIITWYIILEPCLLLFDLLVLFWNRTMIIELLIVYGLKENYKYHWLTFGCEIEPSISLNHLLFMHWRRAMNFIDWLMVVK